MGRYHFYDAKGKKIDVIEAESMELAKQKMAELRGFKDWNEYTKLKLSRRATRVVRYV